MKVTAKKISQISDSYLALVQETPLRAIKTRHDYEQASEMLDRLAVRDDLDFGQQQYLDAIEVLIEAYEDSVSPPAADHRSPLERLKALMASSRTKPAQLQKVLGGSQSMVSMILNGQRALSKKTIAKLADHFKLEPAYFL